MRPTLATCVLAACGSAAPRAGAPAAAAGACPGADRVVVVRWMEMSDDGTKLPPGWRAYLTNQHVERDDRAAYTTTALPADAPRSIWIYPVGGAPCHATATAGFELVTNVGPISEQTGVELSGCAKPDSSLEDTVGLVGDDAIAGCTWTMASGAGIRSGEFADDGVWHVPDGGGSPIPAELSAYVEARACDAPCVAMWRVLAAAKDAYDVTQTWMKTTTGDACSLEHDDATQMLVRSGDRFVRLPDDAVGNQELWGVFRDAGGPRLLVLDDVGEISIFTIGTAPDAAPIGSVTRGGGATPALARHVVWFDKNEEDANWRSMAPYCGP
jgi:hypothetical protein